VKNGAEMAGYFIAGTDTGVGKTVVASWLVAALDGEYWKPVQAGLEGETDEAAVRRLTGLGAERFHPSAYRLKAALSPHQAARQEGIVIELSQLKAPPQRRPLIIEGAGGLLVPLNDRDFIIDLISTLGFPVILVARSQLGTINHTLLSLEALRARRLPVAGVVVNGPPNAANRDAIAAYGKVPVIAELPLLDPLGPAEIKAERIAKTPLPGGPGGLVETTLLGYLMATMPATRETLEYLRQGSLPQLPHPPGGHLHSSAGPRDEPRLLEGSLDPPQCLQVGTRLLAQRAAQFVDVDVIKVGPDVVLGESTFQLLQSGSRFDGLEPFAQPDRLITELHRSIPR